MKIKIAENVEAVERERERERESYSLFNMEFINKTTHKKFNKQHK